MSMRIHISVLYKIISNMCIPHYNPSNLFARHAIGLSASRDRILKPNTKTGEYPRIFPNFQNCARCEKDLKDIKDNSFHLRRKYAGILVLGHYPFLVAHSFPRASLSKTVRFSEQIMSADKYPNIFSCQMATIYPAHPCRRY